ncbi:phosphopantetheine adenylyltransferase [Methanococcus voltae]|uniref:Phosphopantetheine adenylyltransferase n=1 Tax=Methanococcus voltae (strain ATCC BAA-1334 / A3) TaxID=456320 RepID=D7DRV5_METV3|nr:phosphopantetheine adenylyltransferase [Methanococcus voltae]MCS3901390.1 pantetheine-phosphate adenylyltransferase [Methanococcus voltae]
MKISKIMNIKNTTNKLEKNESKSDLYPKKVVIGGTFDIIHKGHEKLLKYGSKFGKLYIGITSDEYLKKYGKYEKHDINPLIIRIKKLETFLSENDMDFDIQIINDPYGDTLETDYDYIIVSPETLSNAEKINEIRVEKGKKPLKIELCEFELAEDNKPISTTRIRNNELDKNGHTITYNEE